LALLVLTKNKTMRYYLPALSLVFILFACQPEADHSATEAVSPYAFDALNYDESLRPFYYGVASGDPQPEQLVIWTKALPPEPQPSVEVDWEVAEDSLFTSIIRSGTYTTDSTSHHTAKVLVDGLVPDRYYFYRFRALGEESVTGRTKTTPVGKTDELRFAVVSCNNYEGGYFAAFDKIAQRNDLDAVLHLGDYIYEYGPGVYGDSSNGRFHEPPYEIINLQDYRTRYAQYRLDKDLMRMHQMHPVIAIWDDHEIANNAYTSGAQNHQEAEEGPYDQRRSAAVTAYFEWMPLDNYPNQQLYRSFEFGDMAELMMLDERLAGRDQPVDSLSDPAYASEERSLLGEEQFNWLAERLTNTGSKWKIIGNQVIFSDLKTDIVYGVERNLDAWDGYPASKMQVANAIRENQVENVIILSGDTHTSWAFETALNPDDPTQYNPETALGAFAVEFGTPSITSGNINERIPTDSATRIAERLMEPQHNPHLKYVNLSDHGYLLLTLREQEAIAEWYFMEDIQQPQTGEYLAKTYRVAAGQHQLQEIE
jgi:alkaline phosphatase D